MYKVGDAVYYIEGLRIKTAVVREVHECYVLLFDPTEGQITSRLNRNVDTNLRKMEKRLVELAKQKKGIRQALEVESSEELTPEQVMSLFYRRPNLTKQTRWWKK